MTIGVGIVCKDGIAIASDSQAESYRGVGVKRTDYNKINVILGNSKDCPVNAVAIGAGNVAFIQRAMKLLQQDCEDKRHRTADELAEAAEAAMVKLVKKYLVERSQELGFETGQPRSRRSQQRQLRFPALDVHMLLAAVDSDGGAMLCTLGEEGVSLHEESYTSIGSGSAYAEYVLQRLYTPDLTTAQGADCVAYTVEEVKKVDPGCGGPTQVAVVTKDRATVKTPTEVRELVARLEIRDGLLSKLWQSLVIGRKSPDDVMKFLES